jgi:hypothetical protein
MGKENWIPNIEIVTCYFTTLHEKGGARVTKGAGALKEDEETFPSPHFSSL